MKQKTYIRVSDFSSFFICKRRSFFQNNLSKIYSEQEVSQMLLGTKAHQEEYQKMGLLNKKTSYKKSFTRIFYLLCLNLIFFLLSFFLLTLLKA